MSSNSYAPNPGSASPASVSARKASSVRKLNEVLNAVLNETDKVLFVEALNEYHRKRDIYKLAQTLKTVCATPAERRIIPYLRHVIPHSDLPSFDEYCQSIYENMYRIPRSFYNSVPGRHHSSETEHKQSRPNTIPKRKKGSLNFGRSNALESHIVKKISVRQSSDPKIGFGFSIRGGADLGLGIFVSYVDPDGPADRSGLSAGDQILALNDLSFETISHDDAVKLIKSAKKLHLTVQSLGRVPGSYVAQKTYMWVDSHGRAVSPPPEIHRKDWHHGLHRRSHSVIMKRSDERRVNLVVDSGKSLGLLVRGGAEYHLGIYITGVDPDSVAENSGLKVGDQIVDVNGHSFLDITHNDAVEILKSSKHMVMTVKDVGKLPYARTILDQTKWILQSDLAQDSKMRHTNVSANESSNGYAHAWDKKMDPKIESAFSRGAGSQLMLTSTSSQSLRMIDEQARLLLNESEIETMNYYLNEYREGYITVDALVLALFELLNTYAKFSLLSEIRSMVAPKDMDRFDSLVLKQEVESLRVRQQMAASISVDETLLIDRDSASHRKSVSRSLSSGARLIKDTSDCLQTAIDMINEDSKDAIDVFSKDKEKKFLPQDNKFLSTSIKNSMQTLAVAEVYYPNIQGRSLTGIESERGPSEDSGVDVANGNGYRGNTPSRITQPSKDMLQENLQDNSSERRDDKTEGNILKSSDTRTSTRMYASNKYDECNDFIEIKTLDDCYLSNNSATSAFHSKPSISRLDKKSLATALKIAAERKEEEASSSGNDYKTRTNISRYSSVKNRDNGHSQRHAAEASTSKENLSDERMQKGSRSLKKMFGKSKAEKPKKLTMASMAGRTVVVIQKTKPTLGMAIEGGADTRQPLPRVIHIQPNGCASESGGLKVGHVVLEVDGKPTDGMNHQEAAQLIADAFHNKEKSELVLVVKEVNKLPV